MSNGFWLNYSILFVAAILGSVAILPYGLRLAKEAAKSNKPKLPLPILLLLSILQNAILFALFTALGLLAAHQIGLDTLLIQPIIRHILIALLLGLGAGGVLLIADLFFLPYFPKKLLDTALKTTQLENFVASFYGGINEEILMRLFGISGIVWLLATVFHAPATHSIFWIANFIMAIVFALGHLPALKNLIGTITSPMLARTLILNGIIGLLCGWLFWNYGIVAAMIAHFAADIVYHIGGTFVLRLKLAKK